MTTKQLSIPTKRVLIRNIAISFFIVATLLAVVVGYTAYSHATIDVTLKPIKQDVAFRILLSGADPLPTNAIPAQFKSLQFNTSATIPLQTAVANPDEPAGGVVTLHNETNRPQLLVASTRLLTADGVQFRLQNRVEVPAEGKVQAIVKADEVGDKYLIGPTQFTIPGLSAAQQEVIYATSEIAMVSGGANPTSVTQADVEAAREKVKQQIVDEVVRQLSNDGIELDSRRLLVSTKNENLSNEVGEVASALTMSAEAMVVYAEFDESLLRNKVTETADIKSGNLLDTALKYELQGYDTETQSMAVVGTTSVGSSIDPNSSIFSMANFVGSTPTDVQKFLLNYEGITAVDITLSPYWHDRLPRSSRNIELNFKLE